MSPFDASVISEMRKLCCDLGVLIGHCNDSGQLSCAVRLAEARESIMSAVHIYKPGQDERQLNLEVICEQ